MTHVLPAALPASAPGGRPAWTIALCAIAVLIDGIDAQVLGYVGPVLRQSWHLTPDTLGAVFSAALFGMMGGAMVMGIVGDRLGRKPTICLCVSALGLCTALAATATSVGALIAWRVAAGFALGGVGPNAYALTSEHSGTARRALFITIVATAFPLGGGLGGLAAAPILTAYGWQAVFVASGILTLALVPFLIWRLREGEPVSAAAAPVATPRRFPLFALFAEGRAVATVLIWSLYFATMLGLYFLSNWLPTLAHDAGMPLRHSVLMMSALQFGGVFGSVAVALLLARMPAGPVLAVTYALAALLIVVLGQSGSQELLLGATALGVGACLNAALIALISLASGFYSASMRSTGIGWGSALGRMGAATGPLLGGLLLAAGWARGSVFTLVAVPVLGSALAAMLLTRSLGRRRAPGEAP